MYFKSAMEDKGWGMFDKWEQKNPKNENNC